MGFLTNLKAQKALTAQGKGNVAEAEKLYEEAFAKGINTPRYVLSYAVLLLRSGQYEKAKELLVKHQKDPGMTGETRNQLVMYFAVASHKLGKTDTAISKLEDIQRHGKSGLLYQTLGYIYIDKYDIANTPDFSAIDSSKPEPAKPDSTVEVIPGEDGSIEEKKTAEQLWQEGREKALAYNQEAVDYDEDDPVCLDNLAQTYYRVLGDKEQAKIWFDKAISAKEGQIDTLWFLSRYDLDAGNRSAALEKLEKALEGRFSPLNYITKDAIEKEIARLKA